MCMSLRYGTCVSSLISIMDMAKQLGGLQVYAVDASPQACAWAAFNAQRLNLQAEIEVGCSVLDAAVVGRSWPLAVSSQSNLGMPLALLCR